MKYQTPLSPEFASARLTMPVNADGFSISLFYTPVKQLPMAVPAWREWCRVTPKHLWPEWIERWSLEHAA